MALIPFLLAFQAQSAIIVATVIDSTATGLPDAIVEIDGTPYRGKTDAYGRVFFKVSPGRYTITVRRLGYAELHASIATSAGVAAPLYTLSPLTTNLQKVVVKASELKPDRYAGTTRFDAFYRRRAQGLGTFLTRETIDSRNAQKSEDLLRMAGVQIRYRGSTPFAQFPRCDQVNVYIDGIRSHDGFRDFFSLSPLDIEAMEVYHGLATVPPEFSPEPNDCAAIVVWTRWR